mgnify:CR=1 FL=1
MDQALEQVGTAVEAAGQVGAGGKDYLIPHKSETVYEFFRIAMSRGD